MKYFLCIVGVLFIVGGCCVFFFADSTYKGKVVFSSEQEYIAFKTEIAKPQVKIDTTDVLSSAPPIVVQFSVITPNSYEFPYGEEKFGGIIFLIVFPIAAGLVFLVGGVRTFIRGDDGD